MAGFSMQIEYSDKGLEKALDRLLSKMDNMSGFYKNVGDHVQTSTADRFESETAPDGSSWAALSPVTLEARAKRGTGNTKLRESGDLFGSINYQASADGLKWGTPSVYGAIHQFGGQAGKNNKVTIPARPYLGLSADDEQEILKIAEDWVGL